MQSRVEISDADSKFREVLAVFLRDKQKIRLSELSEEKFEESTTILRTQNSDLSDEELTAMLSQRLASDRRLESQAQGLWLFWLGLNAYLFWSVGLDQLFSWKAALWLVVGSVLTWSIVGYVGALLEGFWLMFGWHYKIFRALKYLVIFLVFRPVFNLIFTGKL